MKKIINNPNNVVKEMLQGMAKSDPSIRYIADSDIIVRSQKADKVGILTGGGSGHEPAHAGYVGYGMLDAAVAGNVFASPGCDAVERGIHEVDSGKGVLMIIKNYSGDIFADYANSSVTSFSWYNKPKRQRIFSPAFSLS